MGGGGEEVSKQSTQLDKLIISQIIAVYFSFTCVIRIKMVIMMFGREKFIGNEIRVSNKLR